MQYETDVADTTNLKGNIIGGLAACITTIPLAIAFGVQSGLGALSGLYGAVVLGLFAAIFGGTPAQISGPTGPMTVIATMLIASAIDKFGDIELALSFILFTFVLSGFFQIALGLLRVGNFIHYIPYTVISGFMTGMGIILLLFQIYPFLGHHSPSQVYEIIDHIQVPLHAINWQALSIALSTIGLIYGTRRITKKIPSTFVSLVIMTIISIWLKVDVPIIGHMPSSMPTLNWTLLSHLHFEGIQAAIIPAIVLGAVGAIESLLTAVVADNMTQTAHQSDRELIGQGIGNSIAGFLGGIPGAGAPMRTVVNIKNGGTNPLSGITHSLIIMFVAITFSPYISQVPLAILSGILATVGLDIIDYKGIGRLRHIPKAESFLMISVIFLTAFVNLVFAVAIGIFVACVMFMKKMSDIVLERSANSPMHYFHSNHTWQDEAIMPQALQNRVYIKHLHGPLFFNFTAAFHDVVKNIPNIKAVIIRMEQVPFIDQSGLYALEDAYIYLETKGIRVILTGIKSQPEMLLRSVGIIPHHIAKSNLFQNFQEAIASLENESILQSEF